jgi:hypothetical protein
MFGVKTSSDAGKASKAREVRGWVYELLGVPEDATVMVTELACSEPGCPPVETVVAILGEGGRTSRAKIARPLSEVARDDVAKLELRVEGSAP